ncbi:Sugar or nucleoside kinase, ribokinase family [Faunimonas pinastri]|uniref:Sugar or nucleoside kinase, ribokinase family n=1 Tax=Faunimonas pinastri TaxID=1855383 RepID=A0A1H9NWB2_9HYPH|nr:sugar kinase [Faunimonas pinastri]SER40087.1 Sugar or nucleoside kinase, ribokinase family [Faunimonas pinastri]
MKKIVTLGEILVEIMAVDRGQSFRAPGTLVGPFASGAPAIFIDQVAKLGQPCGIVSCVGDDDFGWLNIERLRGDGVDVSAIRVHPEQVTGSAFVRYQENGERDFVFNIKNSACGHISMTEQAEKLLAGCDHFHIMGSSLFSFRIIDVIKKAIEIVKGNGGTVSFDPNIRKEMLNIPEMRAALEFMLEYCDIFLPSGPEISLLTEADDEETAIREILDMGVSSIVVKRGPKGSSYYDAERSVHGRSFPVEELDPTGAGDCFGATYVTCRLQGRSVEEALRYANASGARTVTRKGPMEGASSFAELDAFIASHEVAA